MKRFCAKRPLRPCAQSKLDFRPSVRSFVRSSGKNVTFVLADRRGGHMLESKHDLKLENCRILQGPEKRGPKLIAPNIGWFEDPVFGSFLDTFGELFS